MAEIHSILSNNLIDDMVMRIYQEIHKEAFKSVLDELKEHKNLLERALYDEGMNATTALLDQEVKFNIDLWVEWHTALITYEDNKFIMMHDYIERPELETFLVEGILDNGIIKIERICYQYHYKNIICHDLQEILDKFGKVKNQIPFQWVFQTVYKKFCLVCIEYSHISRKKWKDPVKAIQWFRNEIRRMS